MVFFLNCGNLNLTSWIHAYHQGYPMQQSHSDFFIYYGHEYVAMNWHIFENKNYIEAQVVNAICGVFKHGYFSSIYTLENLSTLSLIMFAASDLMVWTNL